MVSTPVTTHVRIMRANPHQDKHLRDFGRVFPAHACGNGDAQAERFAPYPAFFFTLIVPLDNPARGKQESSQICSGSIREMAEIAKPAKRTYCEQRTNSVHCLSSVDSGGAVRPRCRGVESRP